MPSIPLTPDEERRVLSAIGVQTVEDLFSTVPPKIRQNADFKLNLGKGHFDGRGFTEHELRAYFSHLAQKNAHWPKIRHFLGGGIYDNIIPAIVNQLALRGEFLTCYTPYQPEVAQGTLQVIFEFQTLMVRLTGMQVANASMYDGATATAEAVLMAKRLFPKSDRVIVAESLPPDYCTIIQTLLRGFSAPAELASFGSSGSLDLEKLIKQIREGTPPCAVVVGYPNYFGAIEPLDKIRECLPKDCLLVVSVPDASALSIFEAPGALGADIVAGEAHQLGTPMLLGGPHVGFFATRKEFLRQMPGRLAGETTDIHGKRAYTLTLSTREQHIRRERATSNICTNQGLIALRTAIYLSFLGKQGFYRLGETNHSLFDYLAKELESNGIRPKFKNALLYREGVFEIPNLNHRFQKALSQGMIAGIRMDEKMGRGHEDFSQSLLICVNPKHTRGDLDALVEVLSHD